MKYLVSTERLGWPPKRLRRAWWPIETQKQRRYDDEPDRPTATCHLQEESEQPALCGYPWELLVTVPSQPSWTQLHPDLRCDECASASGGVTDPGGPYVYDYERP